LLPKRSNQHGTTANPTQCVTCFRAEMPEISRAKVWKLMRFPVPPEILHRIEFRRIGGQELKFEPPTLHSHEIAHEPAAVLAQAVPDDKDVPVNMSEQVRKEDDDLGASDGARKQPEIEVPPRHPRNSRERLPVEVEFKHWSLSPWSPRSHSMGPLAQSAFVDEDDGLSSAFSVFFSSGQRWCFHRWILSSSRSRARRAGRCGVHPRDLSTRQACTVEYFTPHSRSIRSTTRHDVQRLVPYPSASGPRLSPFSILRRSSADIWGGRPVRAARFKADRPPLFSCFAQRFTDCRWTPILRATSASVNPSLSSFAACMRRCSNFTRSNLTPAGCPMPDTINETSVVVTTLCNAQ
jgi:hypothetical protein